MDSVYPEAGYLHTISTDVRFPHIDWNERPGITLLKRISSTSTREEIRFFVHDKSFSSKWSGSLVTTERAQPFPSPYQLSCNQTSFEPYLCFARYWTRPYSFEKASSIHILLKGVIPLITLERLQPFAPPQLLLSIKECLWFDLRQNRISDGPTAERRSSSFSSSTTVRGFRIPHSWYRYRLG